jgi:hypothetical protein
MLEGQNCCLGRILSHFSSWLLEQTMKGTRDRGVIASTRILCGKLALAWLQGWKNPVFFKKPAQCFFCFFVF